MLPFAVFARKRFVERWSQYRPGSPSKQNIEWIHRLREFNPVAIAPGTDSIPPPAECRLRRLLGAGKFFFGMLAI